MAILNGRGGLGGAVKEADQLLGDVMSTRGYPVSDFEHRVADRHE
jgi:hypothetical protein